MLQITAGIGTPTAVGGAASRDEARRLRLAARLGSGKGPHSRRPVAFWSRLRLVVRTIKNTQGRIDNIVCD